MKIIINSYIKGHIALKHLLDSFEENKIIDFYDIIVVIGGYYNINDYEISKKGGITYIHCNHNSIDFTGLITLCELFFNDIHEHYLYLHDTCKIGKNFCHKLKAID